MRQAVLAASSAANLEVIADLTAGSSTHCGPATRLSTPAVPPRHARGDWYATRADAPGARSPDPTRNIAPAERGGPRDPTRPGRPWLPVARGDRARVSGRICRRNPGRMGPGTQEGRPGRRTRGTPEVQTASGRRPATAAAARRGRRRATACSRAPEGGGGQSPTRRAGLPEGDPGERRPPSPEHIIQPRRPSSEFPPNGTAPPEAVKAGSFGRR